MKEFPQSAPNVCICTALGGKGRKRRRGRGPPTAFYLSSCFDCKIPRNPCMNISQAC